MKKGWNVKRVRTGAQTEAVGTWKRVEPGKGHERGRNKRKQSEHEKGWNLERARTGAQPGAVGLGKGVAGRGHCVKARWVLLGGDWEVGVRFVRSRLRVGGVGERGDGAMWLSACQTGHSQCRSI